MSLRGEWSLLLAALALVLTVQCATQPAPQPSPSPTLVATPAACVVPPDGPQWHALEGITPTLVPAVRGSMEFLGLPPGPTPEDSLDALARDLVRRGYCAGRQSDAVMVRRDDGLWEEMHAVAYGTGQWLATPYRRAWAVQP
jgi:hypothetical protein